MSTVCSDVVKVVTFVDFQLSQGSAAKYCGSVGNVYSEFSCESIDNEF